VQFDSDSERRAEQRGLCCQLGGGPNNGYRCGRGPLTIDTAKKERWYFKSDLDPQSVKLLRVGERVTVHYYITGRGNVYAKKVEKAGKSEKGSKNR